MEPTLAAIDAFAEIVEANDLDGLPFQHYALCGRRAWLHLKRIGCAHLDSHMQNGIVMHEISKPRDASVEGLMGLSPDRIDWRNRTVYEAKGSAGARDAVARQTAFYALMLWRRTRTPWRAANDILSQKRTREIDLTADLVEGMVCDARALSKLKRQEAAPDAARKPICEKCSYRFLCGFA